MENKLSDNKWEEYLNSTFGIRWLNNLAIDNQDTKTLETYFQLLILFFTH